MMYDTRTRRTQRLQKARIMVILSIVLSVTVGLFTFFSMHVYWPSELMGKLVLRLSGGQNEYALPAAQPSQDWKGRKDISATFAPTSLVENRILFSPPQSAEERQSIIDKRMRRDKFRSIKSLSPVPLALLSEQADRSGHMFLRKRVLVVLPGESVEFSADAFSSPQPELVFRCLGATADRLDLPGRLTFHHSSAGDGVVPISPRGEPVSYQPPQLTATTPLRLTWDKEAPGLLVIAGEFKARNRTPGALLVTFNSTELGLGSLVKTQQSLRKLGFNVETLHPVWPSTVDPHADIRTVLEEPVSPEGARLGARLTQLGFASLKINFGPHSKDDEPWADFDTEVDVVRQRELRLALQQTLQRLSREDLQGSLVSLHIEIPTNRFGLTWKSALEADTSLVSWLYASWLGKALAPKLAQERQAEEKSLQLDEALSGFLASPAASGIGTVVLASHASRESSKPEGAPPVIPGEVIIAGKKQISSIFKSLQTTRDIPHAVLAALTEGTPIPSTSLASVELARDDLLVSERGWLSLPILSAKDETANHVAVPERIGFLAEVRKERERRGFRHLNFLIPHAVEPWSLAVRGIPAASRCQYIGEKNPLTKSFADGIFTIATQPSADPLQLRCSWRLPSPQMQEILFSAQRAGQPVAPAQLAFGAFGISGTLLTNAAGEIALSLTGEFAPAMVPPQHPEAAQLHAWVDDFSPEQGGTP